MLERAQQENKGEFTLKNHVRLTTDRQGEVHSLPSSVEIGLNPKWPLIGPLSPSGDMFQGSRGCLKLQITPNAVYSLFPAHAQLW